ncbi:hypothetical protein E2C01_052923 [Portunus trituberculatus]|uniref:Uncharacterized protein n=1 Tax=Portunus trituberculatus TaxID=210409 RepID=A0A5B7GIZ7_PORTR|nr:hypothetical protein [Portunus trituberculatus]
MVSFSWHFFIDLNKSRKILFTFFNPTGFVPKELFEGRNSGELRSILCQRCYFLKIHKTALSVKVDPNMYEKLLEPIKQKRALVLLVVDLLDVPCSIWPNIMDIIDFLISSFPVQ